MSPERAAEVLGVDVDADRHVVEHAFQRRARATHPDTGSDGADADAFAEADEARRVLLALRIPADTSDTPRVVAWDAPRPQGPVLLATWTAMLLLAAFLAVFRAAYPFTIVEPLVRWAVLIVGAVGFAASGRRTLAVLAVVAELASVGMTIAVTSFGGLVGMLITLPALLGAFTGGIARWRLRAESASDTAR